MSDTFRAVSATMIPTKIDTILSKNNLAISIRTC